MRSITLHGSGSGDGENHENAMALHRFYLVMLAFKFPGEAQGPAPTGTYAQPEHTPASQKSVLSKIQV